MNRITAILLAASAICFYAAFQFGRVAAETKPEPLTIEWVGQVAVGDVRDPYFPYTGYLKNVQLGLRSDGVLVWKTNKPFSDTYQK